MRSQRLIALFLFIALAAVARAENVTGTILIKRRLTKKSVTPAVSVYQRGAAVKLGQDTPQDPIAYEQSRVVIYLEASRLEASGLAGAGPTVDPQQASAPPQMAQLDRRFSPDLVVIPAGSTVLFPNMDPIFHNVFSLSKAKSFDLGSYDKGQTRRVMFPKPGIVDVYCHLHPNMAATVVVTPNRWYARPDSSGLYRIGDIPPGQYTVVAWHKSAGFFRKQITIAAGHDSVVDFFIPLEEDAK